MIHLETSFLISALDGKTPEAAALTKWLRAGEPIGINAICWAEFLCGPLKEPHIILARDILGNPLPFTPEAATLAARLHNATGRRRGAFIDCLIAAATQEAEAALATSNGKDFGRFVPHGLRLAFGAR